MSKNLSEPSNSEEVDLGQIFKLIGNAFDRLFKFIGTLFIGLYDVVLLLLIHFFKRLKWYVLALVIGLILGYFIDKNSPYQYGANMQIETNYDSARQVYENISFLNQLRSDSDFKELSERLNISTEEASAITGFAIEPNIDENNKIELFSKFRDGLDSLTQTTFTYDQFVEGLSSFSFVNHKISAISRDKFIFQKLNNALIKELSGNAYLNEIKDITLENLKRKEKILDTQKEIVDSLRRTYLAIRKSESEKENFAPGSGSNLFLGDAQQQNLVVDETKLVEQALILENQKLDVYLGLVESKNIINVISEFPAAGYNISKVYEKAIVTIPMLLISLVLLIFTILGLSRYLKNQEERLLHKK